MPFLSNAKLSTSFFRSNSSSSVKSDYSMGAGQSRARKYGRGSSGTTRGEAGGNIDNNNNNNNNLIVTNPPYPVIDNTPSVKQTLQADPWSPPPYTPTPPELSSPYRYSPDSVPHVSSVPPPFTAQQQSSRSAADDSEYSFLAKFDTIFLVDDSGSMAGRLWKEAEEAIAAITPICTQYDPDGIDIYFLNHYNRDQRSGAYTNISSPSAVQHIFNRVQPHGMTPVGHRLRQILFPYLRRVERMAANTDDYGQLKSPNLAVRPINIIVITDGVFSDDAESVILNAARTLDQCQMIPWQIGIQFFQIGTDRAAQKHLEQLDDDLGRAVKSDHVRDIVDTVPWKGQTGRTLSGDGILKVVLGAVNKKFDRQKGHAF